MLGVSVLHTPYECTVLRTTTSSQPKALSDCPQATSFVSDARFGLLHKGAKRQGHHKEHKEHASEQQLKEQPRRESTPSRDFTPQQKVKPSTDNAASSAALTEEGFTFPKKEKVLICPITERNQERECMSTFYPVLI